MRQSRVDFAIVGASPLARLLAGLLSAVHGKSVLLQAQTQPGYRLARSLDLSVAAMTRPESWALLGATVPEATRLITRIGKRAAIARLDPILVAEQAPGQQALAHIHHMAGAYGLASERTPVNYLGPERGGVMLRDAVMLRRAVLEPALDLWLAQIGVRRIGLDTQLSVQADGRADCRVGDEAIEIGQTILADDSAILAHVTEHVWPALLVRQQASSILTPPGAPLAAAVMYHLDSGVMLRQRADRGIAAYGPGSIADFAGSLGMVLGHHGAFDHAGQSSHVRLITRDGAAALGRLGGTGADVLAGFGSIGAFLAPAIARWLCGQANAAENDWFGARLVNRNDADGAVSDIGEPR